MICISTALLLKLQSENAETHMFIMMFSITLHVCKIIFIACVMIIWTSSQFKGI